jgi:PAS domain S-box-containing protein
MSERGSGSRVSEEWLRIAEAHLGIGFWCWDIAEAKFSCSSGFSALVGVNAASVQITLGFVETLVHPKDRLTLDDANALATDARQVDRRFRIIRPDGQLRWLQSHASTLFDRAGMPTRVIAVAADVTDDRTLARRLANKAALLHNVARLMGATLWVADEHGQLLDRIGPGEEADSGLLADSASWRDALHPDDVQRVPELWQQAKATGRYHASPRMMFPDGRHRVVHVAGMPFTREFTSERLWGGIATLNSGALATDRQATAASEDAALTPGQIRACRALLDWSADTLARRAGISVSTVRRIENSDDLNVHGVSVRLVMQAFKEAGLNLWRDDEGRFCILGAG